MVFRKKSKLHPNSVCVNLWMENCRDVIENNSIPVYSSIRTLRVSGASQRKENKGKCENEGTGLFETKEVVEFIS